MTNELRTCAGSDGAFLDDLMARVGVDGLAAALADAGLLAQVDQHAAAVREALRAAGPAGLSASECAEQTGLSRVSARRYLEQLVTTGEADVRQRYGTAGRPERRFSVRGRRPQA
jgi:response regulator of citrate/malate metabolism